MYIRDRRCFLSRSFLGALAWVAPLLRLARLRWGLSRSWAGDDHDIKIQNHDSASGIDPLSR